MTATSESSPLSGGDGTDRRNVAIGIGLALLSVFLFSLVDATGKWILATYTIAQLLLIRSIVGVAILVPFARRLGWRRYFEVRHPWLHLLRVGLLTLETVLFFAAVAVLPLADVTVIYMAAPVFVVVMAVVFLGERVGWRRLTAILVGFVGVVIAIGPSAAIGTVPAALALAGSLTFGSMMIITRHLRATHDVVLLVHQVVGTLAFGLVVAPFVWVPMAWTDVLLIVMAGAFATGAHFTVNRSLKYAPASTVAPFQYTLVVWATILGFAVFGDIPQPATVAGGVLIVGSGLYVYFRERKIRPDKTPDLAEPPEH